MIVGKKGMWGKLYTYENVYKMALEKSAIAKTPRASLEYLAQFSESDEGK